LDNSKPLPLQKEAMKITEVQTCKQVNSIVDLDLDSIKAAISELDEMLHDDDFNADEVTECCDRIEELATAISSGVISR
jgi:predicted sugar kinase